MKMLRPVALALIIFSLVATGLPVSDSLAHWTGRSHVHRRAKHRRVRRFSRAWWRRHRAWVRQKQERAARRREERAARLGSDVSTDRAPAVVAAARPPAAKSRRASSSVMEVQGPRAPFEFATPNAWSSASPTAPGTMKFNVSAPDGRAAGTAIITPVSMSSADIAVASTRGKNLAGVPFAALRRTVIDRMVLESGWVVNDMEREIRGRRVYVVVAQSGSGGVARQNWTFYFAEMNGRIYSLSTNAPLEYAAPLAADAEQVLASLRIGSVGVIAVKSPR